MVQQGEAKYVNEWLQQFHPNSLQWKRTRLGSLPNKELNRMYLSTLRWADVIFLENDIVHIVEAKLNNPIKAVSQLEVYEKKFPETSEFSEWKDKQIKLILLCPFIESDVVELCKDKGIEYIVYTPVWFQPR